MKKNSLLRKGIAFTVIVFILGTGIVTSTVSEDKNISRSTFYDSINYIRDSRSNINSKYPYSIKYQSNLPVTFDNGWVIEIVDSELNVGLYSSLALDSNDSPHILYYDGDTYDLKYAYMNGSEWTVELVDSDKDAGWTNTQRSLAIDSNDTIHIVYITTDYENQLTFLKYGIREDGVWNISVIDQKQNNELPRMYPSIGLDSDDNPHIVYTYQKYPLNVNWGGLKYMKWIGASWMTEIIEESCPEYSVNVAQIAMDSEDNPHIAYMHESYAAKYAKRSETGWDVEYVEWGDCGSLGIAIDSDDNPHLSYSMGALGEYGIIRYAWKSEATGWNITLTGVNDTQTFGIALDSDSYPHISGISISGKNELFLNYLRWTGSEWDVTAIDYGDYHCTGHQASIVLDSYDTPHISYYDGDGEWIEGNLRYTWRNNSPPETPNKPSGPVTGEAGLEYTYNTSSTDTDNDKLYYWFDWGDGANSSWIGPFESGLDVSASHSWKTGKFKVRVKVKDEHGSWSDYSNPMIVDIAGPLLEIGEISGGIFKTNTIIRNIGDRDAVDVSWRISLDGGLILMGRETTGSFTLIPPGGEEEISSNLIFGIGQTQIIISSEVPESSDIRKQNATILLVLILRR